MNLQGPLVPWVTRERWFLGPDWTQLQDLEALFLQNSYREFAGGWVWFWPQLLPL